MLVSFFRGSMGQTGQRYTRAIIPQEDVSFVVSRQWMHCTAPGAHRHEDGRRQTSDSNRRAGGAGALAYLSCVDHSKILVALGRSIAQPTWSVFQKAPRAFARTAVHTYTHGLGNTERHSGAGAVVAPPMCTVHLQEQSTHVERIPSRRPSISFRSLNRHPRLNTERADCAVHPLHRPCAEADCLRRHVWSQGHSPSMPRNISHPFISGVH